MFTVWTCESPPNITNTALTVYGNILTYTCLNGTRFIDGTTKKSLHCDAVNAGIKGPTEPCQGISLEHYKQ